VRVPVVQSGDYYLIFQANADNYLCESDGSNNVAIAPVVIQLSPGLPDLAPVSLVTPSSAMAGQTIQVVYALTNRGNETAFSPWSDGLYLSSNAVWDTTAFQLGSRLQSRAVTNGGTCTFTNTVTLPQWPGGMYYLIVRADYGNSVYESVETNNVLSVPMFVIGQSLAPVLTGARHLSDGRFELAIYGAPGANYTLLVSTNLVNWAPVLELTSTNLPVYFRDSAATNDSRRFYRGVLR
jgi:hypothetical protein